MPVETSLRVYRRYLQLEPGHVEEFIAYCRRVTRARTGYAGGLRPRVGRGRALRQPDARRSGPRRARSGASLEP